MNSFNPLGRPKGASNRSTRHAREAIAKFVDTSIPQFAKWLGQVSDGIPQYDGQGNVRKDANGSTIWLVKPDPLAALKVVAEVAEYHLPKLSRQEVTAAISLEGPQDIQSMSTEDLRRMVMQRLGIGAVEGEYSTVTQQVPEFLHPAQEAITQPRAGEHINPKAEPI